MMHRDKLEKERIIKRNEKHVKNVVVDNLIVDKRFNNDEGNKYLRKSDAAYEDFKIREKQKLKEYIKIENKRKENLQRHENKWAQIDLNVQLKKLIGYNKCHLKVKKTNQSNLQKKLKIGYEKNNIIKKKKKKKNTSCTYILYLFILYIFSKYIDVVMI
ncbi:hypothetical protein PFDG_02166 [Plasmodium falciparum Dd2]|uniref:Uncharacterized protein n=1 Tax=Plasmodium falciparum (isolate Dd2) TaxID=57267 RepID=A0A0L7M2B2_PLAF4|nr:hypothetical protein PFDG_02166 [Plasmodium falciparum Dd2]